MLKTVALALFALVAVASCMPAQPAVQKEARFEDQSSFKLNQFIADLISNIIISITDEVNNIVDFILESIVQGGASVNTRSLTSSKQTKAFIGNQRSLLIKKLIKLFNTILRELEQLVNNGIAISTQLIQMIEDALDMLISGEMPPSDIIINCLVQTLGILGRKRREVGPAVSETYIAQIYQAALEKAQDRMEHSIMFQHMTAEQKSTAVDTVKWAIAELLAGKL